MKNTPSGSPAPSRRYLLLIPALILALLPVSAFAMNMGASENGKQDIMALMTRFVMQLGVIVLIARTAGLMLKKVKLPVPSVLVELLIGVAIGPSLLGGVPVPGFPEGIFPLSTATALPISPELYGIATVASIIMLFSAGLETNLSLLLRFSFVGLLVGTGGVVASFIAGAGTTMYFYNLPLSDPKVLFMGMIGMSTSLAITARILSEKRKMDSPEGVTILAAAVIDDVLCIIVLTVVTSIIAMSAGEAAAHGGGSMHAVTLITQAIVVLLAFTVAGIAFARPLSKAIKRFKSVAYIAIVALGLALILAGVFQKAGLAMIIGAYVVGLTLSKTDLADTVRDSLEVMYDFFVPFFFIVMGMLVDVNAILSKEVLIFGAAYSLAMFAGKFLGCGFPTMFLNFNHFGTIRVGIGLAPRGEMAIIIAGIGLSAGMLDQRFFGVAILMVLINDLLAPPLQTALFKSDRKGTKKDFLVRQTVSTPIEIASRKMTELLETRIVSAFRSEGFFSHLMQIGKQNVYHLRKNDMHILLHAEETQLRFESDAKDVIFIKTIAYEALLQINDMVSSVKDLIKPENMLKELTAASEHAVKADSADNGAAADTAPSHTASDTPTAAIDATRKMDAGEVRHAITQGCIIPTLTAKTKQGVVEELVGILHSEGIIKRDGDAIAAVMEREASMSTGIQYGIALPHARTDAVDKITVAVGLAPNGIDYQSLDGEPSTIFVLILSPLTSDCPHIQFLANISTLLNSENNRAKLLECNTQADIYNFFKDGLGS